MATSSKPSLRSFHSAALRTRSSKIPGRIATMRGATLAMTVALALVAGQLKAAPPKSLQADVGPGRIAWFDITTSSLPQSKEFYGRLFDWNFAPVLGSDQAVEIVARGEAIGTLTGCRRQDQPVQRGDLCSGDRYSGKLQEVARRTDEFRGSRVSLQPARRDWSHRPRPRSKWASGRHVLPNAAPIGSGPTQVMIPPRSGDPSRGHAPEPTGATAGGPGRHLASTTVGSDAGLATCRGALSGMRASPPRQRNPLSAR